jgi:broad specificity phosphatase PhoE
MIVWARHGETAANRDGVLLGRHDPDLTEVGVQQARLAAASLARAFEGRRDVRVVTSPLARARATAAIVSDALPGSQVEVDGRLVELSYGEYEGRRLHELPADIVHRWRTEIDFAPPGGESLASVGHRVAELCGEWARADEQPIVAVSHVSPIKAAVCWALGIDQLATWHMHVSLASLTRLGLRGGRGFLAGFNDTAHLDTGRGPAIG